MKLGVLARFMGHLLPWFIRYPILCAAAEGYAPLTPWLKRGACAAQNSVSLGSYTETIPVIVGEKTIQKPSNVVEYAMPSPMHELSPRSAVFARQYSHTGTNWRAQPLAASFTANQPAQKLQKYCTDAGLTPLCSEWWHFNDVQTRSSVRNAGKGMFEITTCLSEQPT